MAVALKIVWRNPEPPVRSVPKITRLASGEYFLEGNSFVIVYRAANRVCDYYGYMPLAVGQNNTGTPRTVSRKAEMVPFRRILRGQDGCEDSSN